MPARLAIVGAGPSGLAALHALRAAGLDAVAFERRPRIGGVWSLDHERPTAAYRSLHLITSRPRTEYGEVPMPDGTPDYPSRDAVADYLEDYAERFGLMEHVRLGAGVERARRLDGGGWEVTLESGSSEGFDALVVANGHNEDARWPEPPYPGEFEGLQLHALDYREPDEFRGQNALVVGMGNSAMDIATDVSHFADRTFLSVRRGSWVIPKRLLGRPADQVIKPWAAVHVPWRLRQPFAERLLRLAVGPPDRYGLPAPQRGLFQDHPTITDTVLSRISHGKITPKPGIESLAADSVRFVDGGDEPVDAIVWCTGYRVSMPFLDESITGPDPKELALYKRIFHLEHDDLFFVGLMQSTGSAFPIVERQAQMLAEHLTGRWKPPSPGAMRTDIGKRRRKAEQRWGPHGRPTMRVDFDGFMHELGKELEHGRKRASAS